MPADPSATRTVAQGFYRRWCPRLLVLVCAATVAWLLTGTASNEDVLRTAYEFKRAGYCSLSDTGVPEHIVHKGVTILQKSKDGSSYCCGYTFTVAVKVAQERGLLSDKEAYQIKRFQREWYGATSASAERQLVLAMENLGIGVGVSAAEAQRGDFVVFWRGKAGHSAIFLDWVRDSDVIIGLRYRSSQNWTLGVADTLEYFTTSGRSDGLVEPNRLYVGRLY